MRYELRVDGAPVGVFATAEDALGHARQVLLANPDHEPEIIDIETGRGFEPGATKDERDDLSTKVGF